MKRWSLNAITIFSFILCVVLLFLWAIGYSFDVWNDGITLGPEFHVGAFDGNISFYSDEVPYQGSIIGLAGTKFDRGIGWDFPGVYYRYFRWQDGCTLWTLTLSILYPVLLTGSLPFVRFICWLHRRGWHLIAAKKNT